MSPASLRCAAAAFLAAALLAGCGEDPGLPPAAPPAKVLAAADLEAHFEKMVEVAQREDRKRSNELARSLVPSRAELRSVLRPGPETEAFLEAYQGPVLETLDPPDPLTSVKKGGTQSVIR